VKPLWVRLLPFVATFLLLAGAVLSAYQHGLSVKDAEWQIKWAERDTKDAEAAAINESTERAKEQARQLSMNKEIQDGQRLIDKAVSDAIAARHDLSVRNAADSIARRTADSETSGNSCAAATSKAATRAAMVLADVLKRADQRANDLAAIADQARARGMTCQKLYDELAK
jgi:hypothetical protein